MKYNFDKLKGKIKEIYNTQSNFAHAMKMTPNTLCSKLNNTFDFTSSEISRSIELLGIADPKEAWELFFTKKVEKKSTINK